MTTYRLHLPHETCIVKVSSDIIIEAPAEFIKHNREWYPLVQMLNRLGIEIEPLLQEGKSDFVTYGDATYELRYTDHNRTQIKRISKHTAEKVINIRFEQLPQLLRMAL